MAVLQPQVRARFPTGVSSYQKALIWQHRPVTIAVLIKVNDGFVLAADSATTVSAAGADGSPRVLNIYNNANKIFNLHKALPIGAMTWGLGNIGPASIATLAKDLRLRFSGGDSAHPDWKLDAENYQMSDVAERAREFFEDEKYRPLCANGDVVPDLGLLVGGYSSGDAAPELYLIQLGQGSTPTLTPTLEHDTGATWFGQPEAITRIMLGTSTMLPQALVNLGVPPDQVQSTVDTIQQQVNVPLVSPAMPIQDAIELAEFLVDATIQFVRFSPGSPTVGGPVEVACITKHEGFRWVARKHYFSTHLNPPIERS